MFRDSVQHGKALYMVVEIQWTTLATAFHVTRFWHLNQIKWENKGAWVNIQWNTLPPGLSRWSSISALQKDLPQSGLARRVIIVGFDSE